MTATGTVERLAFLTRDRFEYERANVGRPIIVSRDPAAWGLISQWSPDHLLSRLGDKPVDVAIADDGRFTYDPSAGKRFRVERMTFRSAASIIAGAKPGRSLYLMQQSIGRSFPELADDVRTPDLLGDEPADAHLWYGSAGNVTPLHHDPLSNLFLQVFGRKRLTLYAPRYFEELYPYPEDARFSHMSRVDVERPDPIAYPRAHGIERLEVTLLPGELLFLPPFWWHHVRSLEPSISVNFWSAPTLAECLVPAGLRLLACVYERDRLQTMGAPFRDPVNGWIGAARKTHALGRRWPAVMLAAAAIELPLRAQCRALGIDEHDGRKPRPLASIYAELVAAGAQPTTTTAIILRLDEAFERARSRQDSLFTDVEVMDILQTVAALSS
jgi:hypothetical protein